MYSSVSTFFMTIKALAFLCLNFYNLTVYGAISLKKSTTCTDKLDPSTQGEKIFKSETVFFDAYKAA